MITIPCQITGLIQLHLRYFSESIEIESALNWTTLWVYELYLCEYMPYPVLQFGDIGVTTSSGTHNQNVMGQVIEFLKFLQPI
jgi:hypothetical protein